MEMDIYMYVSDIKGDLTHKDYEQWFIADSISYDLTRAEEEGAATGEEDVPKLGDISFSKRMDSASPPLFQLIAATRPKDVEIMCHFIKTIGAKSIGEPYVGLSFGTCRLTSYRCDGDNETYTFTAKKMSFQFFKSGKKGHRGMHTTAMWEDTSGDGEDSAS